MSFGGGKSSSTTDMGTMGIAPLISLGAMGAGFVPSGGSVKLSASAFPQYLQQGQKAWLGPEQVGSLAGLLEPMGLGAAEQMAASGVPSQLGLGMLGQGMGDINALMQSLRGSTQATDIAPIQTAAQRFLGDEQRRLAEQMGMAGAFKSDIYGAGLQAAGDVAAQLGTLQFQAEEAAKQRAIEAMPAGLAGVSGRVSNLVNTFGQLFGLEQAARSNVRAESPGGRTADIISWLTGLESPVGNVGSSSSWQWSMCWGAAVYYGWYTPEWFNARRWIMEGWNDLVGRAFRALYLAYGPQLAEMLRRSNELRDYFQPLFVWCERRGREMTYGS